MSLKSDEIETHLKNYHNNCSVNHYRLDAHESSIRDLKNGTEELIVNVNKLTDKVTDLVSKETTREETKNKLYVGIIITIIGALLTILIGIGGWFMKNTIDHMIKNQEINNKQLMIEVFQAVKENKKDKEP